MGNVLVLNKQFVAVHVINWQRAMSLMFIDHARAIDENYMSYPFNDWTDLSAAMKENPNGFVNTPRLRIAVPEIIQLTKYDRLPKRDVKFTRRNIYEHYKYLCAYCGEKFPTQELNLDHVIPRSLGGKTDWTNIITTCIPCNSRKANKTPEQAGMKLLFHPSRPVWKGSKSLLEFPANQMRVSWSRLIDAVYWDGKLEK